VRVAVVGAGLGGLAVAARLQHEGHDVVVLEGRERPGGRAYRLRDAGYTWDTGPSLVTMPWVLEEAFAAAGLDLWDEVGMRRLDPMYRIRWSGEERVFDFADDVDRLEAEVARFDPRDATRVRPFLEGLEPIYRAVILDAGRRPFLRAGDFARLVPRMARLGALRPLHGYVARAFRNPRVREAFSFHSLFIGGDPFRVPALYGALVYLQVLDGGWYVDGGVYSLVEALARRLDVRCGAPVEAIEWSGSRATGVRLAGGERICADAVISNADVLRLPALLGRPAPVRRLRPTMSCFLVYLGTRRTWPGLRHHTLLVGPGFRRFIRAVTRSGPVPATFSTYVHAPARTEAAMAAPGGDSLAILLPAPNLRGPGDWSDGGERLREALLADLEASFGLPGLADDVVVEHRMTPLDFERDLGAEWGNAFSIEPTLGQSAYFRVPNRDRRLRNLYVVGGGTHPGAGIPGVLMGAAITGDLVAADAAATVRRRALGAPAR
jgi:phytoene desaturase